MQTSHLRTAARATTVSAVASVAWVALLSAAAVPGKGALEEAAAAFRRGAYAEVSALSDELSREHADWPKLRYLAGEAALILADPETAETAFRDVLSLRPRAIPARVGLARVLTRTERLEEAESILHAALEAAPQDVGARTALGELFLTSGQPEEARVELAEAFDLDPRNPFTARSYAEALLALGDPPAASAVAETLLEKRPDHPMGHFLLAWAMEREGDDDLAIERYLLTLERDPAFLDAHKNLAILCHTLSDTYQDKERTRLAYHHYRRYFELGGKDATLKGTFEELLKFEQEILGS